MSYKENGSPKNGLKTTWWLYILRCADNTLYTGITNDLKHRVAAHNSGKGAKYIVPSRRPVELVYKKRCKDKSTALKKERVVKNLSRTEKEKIIKTKG